jgi:hypothetical protein
MDDDMICLRHYMAFDTPKAFLDGTLLLLYILCELLANRHGFGDGVGMVKALAGICLPWDATDWKKELGLTYWAAPLTGRCEWLRGNDLAMQL